VNGERGNRVSRRGPEEKDLKKPVRCWELDSCLGLDRIAAWCLEKSNVDRLLATTRLDRDATEPTLLKPEVEHAVYSIFKNRVLETLYAIAWPGTELIGHFGKVYVIGFDRKVRD
jgi:hypothetical protein